MGYRDCILLTMALVFALESSLVDWKKFDGELATVFRQQLLAKLRALLPAILRDKLIHPIGHLLPLGSHRSPVAGGIEQVVEFPDPFTFYHEYIKPGRPLVFRNLAKLMPAYQLWSDIYLRQKYGQKVVYVEPSKIEDRHNEVLTMLLSSFIDRYQNESLYLVYSFTEQLDMLKEINIPRSLMCADLLQVMYDALLWLSSGGTQSVLHFDTLDNINCLLEGTKEFILIDKAHDPEMKICDQPNDYSMVNIDSVDMYRYPLLQDIPWYNVTLEAGDCLFLPDKWLHAVRSFGDRNAAINLWFVHLHRLNDSSCSKMALGNLSQSGPLNPAFEFCEHPNCFRALILSKISSVQKLTEKEFSDLYIKFVDEEAKIADVFATLDSDDDGLVSLSEMYEMEIGKFLNLFPGVRKNKEMFYDD